MRKVRQDVVVVGGGLSGLLAAAAAVKKGKKVTVLYKGAGTLIFAGGNIDILGYSEQATPFASPADGLTKVAENHPYAKLGATKVRQAVEFFLQLVKEEGYPYQGDLDSMVWLPTAGGTLKPTCLVPETMNPAEFEKATEVVVADFVGLKDFYAEVVIRGLSSIPGYKKNYRKVVIDPGFEEGRDVNCLDIARWLDTDEGRLSCIEQMRKMVTPGTVVLVPPVLGTRPNYLVSRNIESTVFCHLVELAGMPPAVTGLRLHALLTKYLKHKGVMFIEQAVVSKAIVGGNICQCVVTGNFDRERYYYADKFILATGGVLGGGLKAQYDRIIEPVFQIPVTVPDNIEEWGNLELFTCSSHPFAKFGIKVDENLRPVNNQGQVILENVHVAGRNLEGYDYCHEKSGNGVAVVSGYQAGMLV